MIETFIALLLAHVLADFVFQSNWIAMGKQARHPGALAAHLAWVFGMAWLAFGTLDATALGILAALTLVHILIDIAKSFFPVSLTSFLADQAAHLVTLAVVAHAAPDMWSAGLWGTVVWLPAAMGIAAGFILATRAGGFAMMMLMTRFADAKLPEGLTNGGALIGFLERAIIFMFVFVGEPAGVGFLIAAKSVLRFDAVKDTEKAGRASEYVIIGTLASFGWAMAVAWGALALVSEVAPLGILPPTP